MRRLYGSLIGAALGFLAGLIVFAGWLPYFSGITWGWEILVIVPGGVLFLTVVGCISGIAFENRIPEPSEWRRGSKLCVQAFLAAVLILAISPVFIYFASITSHKRDDLFSALVGPLEYPVSHRLRWADKGPGIFRDIGSLNVVVFSRDSIDDILAFYDCILPKGSLTRADESGSDSCGLLRKADGGVAISIDIDEFWAGTTISYAITYKEAFDQGSWREWPSVLSNNLRTVPWSKYEGSREVAQLLGPNVFSGARMVHFFLPEDSSDSYEATFATNESWEKVIALMTSKFGPSKPTGKEIFFRGDVGNGQEATITIYAPAPFDPYHTILLDYFVSSKRAGR